MLEKVNPQTYSVGWGGTSVAEELRGWILGLFGLDLRKDLVHLADVEDEHDEHHRHEEGQVPVGVRLACGDLVDVVDQDQRGQDSQQGLHQDAFLLVVQVAHGQDLEQGFSHPASFRFAVHVYLSVELSMGTDYIIAGYVYFVNPNKKCTANAFAL